MVENEIEENVWQAELHCLARLLFGSRTWMCDGPPYYQQMAMSEDTTLSQYNEEEKSQKVNSYMFIVILPKFSAQITQPCLFFL